MGEVPHPDDLDDHDRRPAADAADTRVSRPPPVTPRGWAALDPPDAGEADVISMEDDKTWTLDILPVRRAVQGELWPEVGCLLPGRPVVFLVNLFEPRMLRNISACERIEYAGYDELRKDGWEVD